MTRQPFDPSEPFSGGRGGLPWLLSVGMRPLPLAPLESAAKAVMRRLLAANPRMFSRLGTHANRRFAIAPCDCPFVFLLQPQPDQPELRVISPQETYEWDARISGTMIVLLGLLDGTYDGDALFFTRDLTIEGDTAAVLALRNAIEDADLDPIRLLGVPEAVAPIISRGMRSMFVWVRDLLGAPRVSNVHYDK